VKKKGFRQFTAMADELRDDPRLADLCTMTACPSAGWYFIQAALFCKQFEQTGQLIGRWGQLAFFLRWPQGFPEISHTFKQSRLVTGDADLLVDWEPLNGWLLDRAERARKGMRDRRAKEDREKAAELRQKPGKSHKGDLSRTGRSGRIGVSHGESTVRAR
jgi:hypothetical protein